MGFAVGFILVRKIDVHTNCFIYFLIPITLLVAGVVGSGNVLVCIVSQFTNILYFIFASVLILFMRENMIIFYMFGLCLM